MRKGEKMKYQMGVLFVGVLGAVATTTISGLFAVNQNLAPLRGVISTEGYRHIAINLRWTKGYM
ncbi:hypothetical protein [Bacillus cereus group sp. Bce037]|uniref:hypothetical protein n=1 Tax=unclassified Bacillus cereus group TaxID=2750818 RepID=UPI003F22F707|nr:hypothetical protein [Bacillus cereus]MCU5046981.1 hypothetical protein [Bacillus cereus]QLF01890.1 hypothetical protein F3L01_13055 [Bacillus cereus]